MSNKKGDGKSSFTRAVKNEQIEKGKTIDVPEMIKKDQPNMVLRPRGWDGLVDQEIFDEKWNKQIQKYSPNVQVPKGSSKLSDVFDQITDRRNKRDQDRGRE
ncbi:hypothetical protein MNBD_GAMMA03-676 [hydrothermal vent metagenome]|uniref:Uncharacterized protein n=1 Tax=hydrothermal vent metagenome TaxID=652676 RepID=A0A3B0WJC2_9ZZZZ